MHILVALKWVWTAWYALGVLSGRVFGGYARGGLEEKLARLDAEARKRQQARLERLFAVDEWARDAALATRLLALTLAGLGLAFSYGAAGIAYLAVLVLAGEALLDGVAAAAAADLAYHAGGALLLFMYPLWPLVAMRKPVRTLADRLLGMRKHKEQHEELEDEIMAIVSEGEREGVIEEADRDVIEGVFSLKDKDVAEIMTPRPDIACIELSASLDELLKLAMSSGHSRIPVYQGTRDNIVGVIHVKDLLAYWNHEGRERLKPGDIMRRPLFIPESRKVSGLLSEMQRNRTHLAVLIDEYGGTAGLVTLEDILEEFVGDIADEYDRSQPPLYERLADASYRVKARMRIDEFNELVGVNLPENEDYDTVGGFLASRFGYIPRAGEKTEVEGLEFVVVAASERRVDMLSVRRLEEK